MILHARLATGVFLTGLFCSLAIAEIVEIRVENFRFDADNNNATQFDTVVVNAGDTVRWTLTAGVHTVTSGLSSSPSDQPGALFDANLSTSSPTFERIFDTSGTFPYFCRFHENTMKGAIVVKAPSDGDADDDGMPDDWENLYGLNPTDATDAAAHWDEDSLSNLDEYAAGCSPIDPDTDNDGYWDDIEVMHGSDPIHPESVPTGSGVSLDLNLDSLVNALDIQLVVNGALGVPKPFPSDVDGNLLTNALDVQQVVNGVLGARRGAQKQRVVVK